MFTLTTFIPAEATERVLDAVFAAGAGKIGDYDRCAFVVRGEGRFRPLDGADPYIGSRGEDECVAEDRAEFVVPDERVDAVLAALRNAHPYEKPAFYLVRLDDRCARGV